MSRLRLFATAPAALSSLVAAELTELGGRRPRPRGAGVEFDADLETAYRVCLWTRLATRVLLPLATVPAPDADALYRAARAVPWEEHLDADTTFAVDCSTRNARIGHSRFAALRIKDAVADRFRERTGRRPDVDVRSPALRIHLHLRGGEGRLALDLSGSSLHRRGYRVDAGPAPLRETLAAGLLRFAGWPSPELPALLDPLCGSGTLLVEGALMAADVAPGLLRERFGFEAWRGHVPAAWQRLRDEARERRARGLAGLPAILGSDRDPEAIAIAGENVARAGLAGHVELETCTLGERVERPAPRDRGLLVANPPYGERLDAGDALACREGLRALLAGPLAGWRAALLLPDDLDWPERHTGTWLAVPNGALACRYHRIPEGTAPGRGIVVDGRDFANRLRKNERTLARWRRREGVTCYRVYDADLPDFALAIDLYESAGTRHAHVQEYAAPPQIDPALAAARRRRALELIPECLGVAPEQVVVKTRRRQRGTDQYQRLQEADATPGRDLEVRENGARLLVNLTDHLDTGLFLDHRPVRRWIAEHAAGARFANLFAYTGAASVHAALGGARETVSVDLSAAYLARCERNLALNGFGPPAHRTVRADCRIWLEEMARVGERFDMVFVDPPTFSNSKRMRGTFDVQRDHVGLLERALAVLAPQGTLVFSSNRRGFRLDAGSLTGVDVTDWTRPSVPPDFPRTPPPHRCWLLRHAA